jgi:hypothetical protein
MTTTSPLVAVRSRGERVLTMGCPVLACFVGEDGRRRAGERHGGVRTPSGPTTLLSARRRIPVRSIVDTREGKVRLTSARLKMGRTQSGVFSRGRFEVRQSRKRSLTVLRLKLRLGCRRARSAGRIRAEATAGKRHTLRGNAKGNYRSRTGKGAGTVRGTVWTTIDTCNYTDFVLRRGVLEVIEFEKCLRDFRRDIFVCRSAARTVLRGRARTRVMK